MADRVSYFLPKYCINYAGCLLVAHLICDVWILIDAISDPDHVVRNELLLAAGTIEICFFHSEGSPGWILGGVDPEV